MRRVVITGAGTVNALGHDVVSTFASLRAGRSAIGPLAMPDLERLSVHIGAAISGWSPPGSLDERILAISDRATLLALTAAREAVAQSGLALEGELGERSGVILGTAGGGHGSGEEAWRAVFAERRDRVHPFTVPRLMANAAAARLSIEFGLTGPCLTVATACAAANHAMGLAFREIRSGAATVMLTGGAEAMLTFGGIKVWEGLRVLSPDGCRPFAANRNGMVLGEGAAVYVFEEEGHARARGARILAEVAGFGMSADAADMVAPSADGAARAMRSALVDAGMTAGEFGYVNAHGTGTVANDQAEGEAILRVFGGPDACPPISATKSLHGHCIGAAGAVELLPCLMALNEGLLAPTAGEDEADPAIRIDHVTGLARQAKVSATLSNAFAFGGLNAVIALRGA
jgi:nodulation protein E